MPSPTLDPLPPGFAAAVSELHRVAEEVVAPERKPDNEIALEATPGGFGTPPFEWEGEVRRVRVEGTDLVREANGVERREPLEVDPAGAAALARWYELGTEALNRLRGEATGEEVGAPILWPEHFDVAIELGDEARGERATYGFSPGDEEHPEPYAYVGPWAEQPAGPLWNASGFKGAELGHEALLGVADPLAAALEFMRSRRDALASR
jgi:hypothetical protein